MEIISSKMGVPHHMNPHRGSLNLNLRYIDRYRIKLKTHSRMIEIVLNGKTNKFYLNLPEMEFWIQFWDNGYIDIVNLFLHNGSYYSSMFLNRFSDVCEIGSFCMGTDIYEKDFLCDRISICKEIIGLFFRTKFNFHGSNYDVITSFGNKDYFLEKSNEDLTLVETLVEKPELINVEWSIFKILIAYAKWSSKSKLDRNYNIFDDFSGCKASIPEGIL